MLNFLKRASKALFISDNEQDQAMWLFVGLGNPGNKYKGNRHNVGFMAIEAISDGAEWFPPFKKKFHGLITENRLAGEKTVLLMPQTYMNESGKSVGETARFYKIPPERIIVFHDELDIKPGEVRVKKGGGNAGHNGLKSMQAHLGTPDFWRVRIGIGRPQGQGDVSNYVLSDFAKAEQRWLEHLVDTLSDSAEIIIKESPEQYGKYVKEKGTL